MEVLVGALVLAITTFAVLNGLDGAQKTGRTNKERSVSATLAQQDIERLRSYPITALSNFTQTRSVDVAGVQYSVVSETEWVRDASGTLNCTDDTAQADYLKISSTVNSPRQTVPVKEVSLLTPAAGAFNATAGTLVVKITDRNGLPLGGVTVSLSGAGSFSDTTNSEGCAIFGYIPAGDYDVDVPGRVSWGGDNSSTSQATVVCGEDKPEAARDGGPRVATGASPAGRMAARPPGPRSRWRTRSFRAALATSRSASPATAIDATGLFPFLDGYGVYAGSCAKNNPSFWDPTYFQTSGKGFVTLNPGDFLKDVNVQMGVLTVNVKNSTGTQPGRRPSDLPPARRRHGTGCTPNQLMANMATDSNGNAIAVSRWAPIVSA